MYLYLLPEIIVTSLACMLLIIQSKKIITQTLIFFGLILGALSCLLIKTEVSLFSGSFVINNFNITLKLTLFIIMFAIFIYIRKYLLINKIKNIEFYVLSLFSLLGMLLLISSGNLLMLYLSIELMVLPLYILIAFFKDNKFSIEASFKYFLMGALASGLMLYGISLIYGFSGTFDIISLHKLSTVSSGFEFGLLFVLAGLAFKLGAAPFHMWLPDVYEGSNNPVTLLIGTAPKIAACGMAVILFQDAFLLLAYKWQPFLIILAVLSLFLGNLAAFFQVNFKRMLAYSTIAHVGFLLLGFVALGFNASLYYIVVYAFTMLCAFGILILLSNKVDIARIEDFKGLSYISPKLAFLMMLVMLSLCGIPPLVGFYAKLLILNALIHSGFLWLAILAIIASVIGAYYYLKIIKIMYFDKMEQSHVKFEMQGMDNTAKVLLGINGLGLIGLGIYPAPIINFLSCF